MSYCRWSSDNWKCDLYCYEDVRGGYTTHIAGIRILGDIPEVPNLMSTSSDEFVEAHKKQMAFLDGCKREHIGLCYDNQSFNDPDLQSFLSRLLHLQEVGYNFPDYVLERVKDELAKEVRRG